MYCARNSILTLPRLWTRCIDQVNSKERTQQVQIMGQIYANCRECLIYLGQSLDSTIRALTEPTSVLDFGAVDGHTHTSKNKASKNKPGLYEVFEFFHKWSNSTHVQDLFRSHHLQGEAKTDRSDDVFIKFQLKFFEALRMFMHAPFTPWWTRIWVIQEVALPPQVTILYGTISAPWVMFANAAKEYQIHSNTCCRDLIQSMPRDQERVMNSSFRTISIIQNLRLRYHTDQSGIARLTLLDLLRQFRDRRASDPKDKVYALLSMAQVSSGGDSLTPDYSLSEAEVFCKATLESIYSTESLSVFSTELGRKFRSDLPSWVPDWGAPGGHMYLLRAKTINHYNAFSEAATPTSITPIRGMRLHLQCMRITIVDKVGEMMWGEDPSHSRKTLDQWFYLWREHLPEVIQRIRWSDGKIVAPVHEVRRRQFWRTICADVIHEHATTGSTRRVQGDELSAFAMWEKYSSMSPFSSKEDSEQASTWSSKAELWSLFLSTWPTAPDKKVSDGPDSSYIPGHLANPEAAYNAILDLMQVVRVDTKNLRHWDLTSSHAWKTLYFTVLRVLKKHYGTAISIYSDGARSQIPSIERSISIATLSRRLICGNGFIGLGPADMVAGDVICLLPGGKTPFVLRPHGTHTITRDREGGSSGRQGDVRLRYEIIGDCYLDGWMDGCQNCDPRRWEDIELV